MAQTPGFSEALQLKALELQTRLVSGETVPLAELIQFINDADSDLQDTRKNREKTEKPTDVDFF